MRFLFFPALLLLAAAAVAVEDMEYKSKSHSKLETADSKFKSKSKTKMSYSSNPNPLTSMPARSIDPMSTNTMLEDGSTRAANPECRYGLGWIYYGGYCYIVTSYHENFLAAEELCNEAGGFLADVLTQEENDWLKGILNAVNPKDGTDYWIGGMDNDADKGIQWLTGQPMSYSNFVDGEPGGRPYTHMNFDTGFAWDTKDDANDQDNGFVCKRLYVA